MGLKDVILPFNPDSEEDVRVNVALYFRELGFVLSEMHFEDSFQIKLGHSDIAINKPTKRSSINARSDMLLVRNGKPLAVVETKAPDVQLTQQDRDQGLSYARLITEMPPYTIITNGKEVRVYDTLTTEQLTSDSPTDSAWVKNGYNYSGLSGANQEWACRILCELNYDIILAYCKTQVDRTLADLKSTPQHRKRYSSDLFVERTSIKEAFADFVANQHLGFALYGESGLGKSNEMCHIAEQLLQSGKDLVLFYRAGQLWDGINSAIRNDFIWEFERDEPLPRIIRRITELAKIHRAKLYIFIDGLDEYPKTPELLRAELIDIVTRLDRSIVRLCISCKAHDWQFFIKEREDQLNFLGTCVYPPAASNNLPPGFHLRPFNDDDLIEAWGLYSQVFNISSGLEGETREECRIPIMLRLISEIYTNGTDNIPKDLSNIVIFDSYWRKKMADFPTDKQLEIESVLCLASEIMVKLDQSEVKELDLYRELKILGIETAVYEATIRYGFLSRRMYGDGLRYISFAFEKLRSYVYTMKARHWQRASDHETIERELEIALSSRLGRESLLFFMLTGGHNGVSWLTPIITVNPALFNTIIFQLQKEARLEASIELSEVNVDQLRQRLDKFIHTYSSLKRTMPNLEERISPFTKGGTGIWIHESWYGFRTLTTQFPQPVILIEEKTFGEIFSGRLSEETISAIHPVGAQFTNGLWEDIARQLPEAFASQKINAQMAELISEQALNESRSPIILAERICNVLKNTVTHGIQGSPFDRYWRLLGYSSFEEARSSTCTLLIEAADNLLDKWIAACPSSEGPLRRWYEMNIPVLYVLGYNIKQYKYYAEHIINPLEVDGSILRYLRDNDLQFAASKALSLTRQVLESVYSLLDHNFGVFSAGFSVYTNINARLLLELSSTDWSDFLQLTYIWLPSLQEDDAIIRVVQSNESIAELFIKNRRSTGNIFARNAYVETEINGERIKEHKAIISRVRYPSHLPITDIAYQLIANEAQMVFPEDNSWVRYREFGRFNPDKILRFIATKD